MKNWTLHQLVDAHKQDLAKCHTSLEKEMATTYNRIDIRQLAIEILASRKLTPGEQSILDSF